MPSRMTPKQREAARLDSTGLSSTEIANRIGIANETLSRWRGRRNYQRAVEKLQSEMDKDTLKTVRTLRGESLKAVRVALGHALRELRTANATEAVRIGEFALKVYTATSAQTGRPMEHSISVDGSVTLIAQRAQALEDDELRVVERGLVKLLEAGDDLDDFDDEE